MTAIRDSAAGDNTALAIVARLRAALRAALGSGDRSAAAAIRSALAAIGNAEAVDPVAHGDSDRGTAPSEHFAGTRAGLGAGDVPRRLLTAADVSQIVVAEIAERQSVATEYERLGHGSEATRLRREAGILADLIGAEHRAAQLAK